MPTKDEKAESKAAKSRKQKRQGPRKPLTTYLIFSLARREAILKERPELKSNVTEMSKILGAEWRAMSEEDKMPYQMAHYKDRDRYIKEKEEFESSTNPEAESSSVKPPAAKKQKSSKVKKEDKESELKATTPDSAEFEAELKAGGHAENNETTLADMEDKDNSEAKTSEFDESSNESTKE